LRRAPLAERAWAFLRVLAEVCRRPDLVGQLESPVERQPGDRVDHALAGADRQRRVGGDLRGNLAGGRVELVGRREPVDEAQLVGAGGADRLRCQQQLERDARRAWLSALRASGRFIVSQATPSRSL